MKQIITARDLDIYHLLRGNDRELTAMIDEAIRDMILDTESPFKDTTATRKVVIEISITPSDTTEDVMDVDYKVTPKAAPYCKAPESRKIPVMDNQLSIDAFLTSDNPEA